MTHARTALKALTVGDLGSAVRAARRARGMTQAEVAAKAGVSRAWLVRLERGSPRLEAQGVLDVLFVVGLSVTLTPVPLASSTPEPDPFGEVFARLRTKPRAAATGRAAKQELPRPAPTPSTDTRHSEVDLFGNPA